jgi:hypothetical protein
VLLLAVAAIKKVCLVLVILFAQNTTTVALTLRRNVEMSPTHPPPGLALIQVGQCFIYLGSMVLMGNYAEIVRLCIVAIIIDAMLILSQANPTPVPDMDDDSIPLPSVHGSPEQVITMWCTDSCRR